MMEKNFSKFNILESERSDLEKHVRSLPPDVLLKKPDDNKWSTLQILFHIIKSEQLILLSMNHEMKSKLKRKAGISAFVRFAITKAVLHSGFKIKAPPLLRKMPDEYNLSDLLKRWSKIREELKNILTGFADNDLKYALFKHPYAGDFNLKQTLNFMLEHLKHHKKQIEKITSSKQN